jgi:hypothetical protein
MIRHPGGRIPLLRPRVDARAFGRPRRALLASLALLAAAACTQEVTKTPIPVTPPEDRATAPVIRTPLPETPIPATETPSGKLIAPPAPAIVIPPNAQYVCVTDAKGQRQQTVIEFVPAVASICLKHPEMGPCQYERNACRRSGGRVFAAEGKEITMATEAEYDKKVMRIRFKAN